MAKLGTHLALRKLLNEEDYLLIWLRAGFTKEDRARMRFRFNQDQLSLDKMEEILEKCGFTVAQQKQWNTPKL